MPALQFSMIANSNAILLILGYGLTMYAAFKYRVRFLNTRLLIVLTVIMIWTIIQKTINASYFEFSPFIILEILAAYIIISIYRETLFRHYENTTYFLSIVAILGWLLNIVAHPLLVILADAFGISADGEKTRTLYIYTVNIVDSIRNPGFSWEPGKTACMTCVAILFYLMRTNYNLSTIRFWVLIICLFTTLSTTGFCTFIVILLLCYISMKKFNPIILCFLGISALTLFSLPFMYEKLSDLTKEASEDGMVNITSSLDWSAQNELDENRNFYVPQRFEGLVFSYINFENSNKLIGDGRDFQKFYINRVNNWFVKTSEGILEHSVRYGLIIGLLSYYLLYRASRGISQMYDIKNKWLFFIVFILISISYNFWELPLFMAIWMMPIYGCCKDFSLTQNKTSKRNNRMIKHPLISLNNL